MSDEEESRKFHETKDLKIRDEIYRLSRELIKLDEPWVVCVEMKRGGEPYRSA
jgi:hypothetical protein